MKNFHPRVKCSAFSLNRDEELKNLLLSVFPEAVIGPTDENIPLDEFLDFASDAEALIVGREKVDERLFEAAPHLKVISKYGVGVDNIDFNACQAHGVHVLHATGVNRQCVAELTLGFILASLHNIVFSDRLLRRGQWVKDGGWDLAGKTVGIVGFGNVGTQLARLLQPFEVKILVHDILDKTDACKQFLHTQQTDLNTLLTSSDIVSLHVPLTSLTRKMIAAPQFAIMKTGSILINTARGGILDESDLLNALNSGSIRAACLDVFEEEPLTQHPLLQHPRVITTPHIGGNSREARRAMAHAAISMLAEYLKI
ncbi:MAG: phosphoglycerate dehydrogenase [Flavobacteriales bacterium]|nr:phosphoglycerate dehydrogenase [Flavobacteriales bacterium]MDW8432866.1 phosphoglycerate dehydrogenase [Flavobacteriales bacterium]